MNLKNKKSSLSFSWQSTVGDIAFLLIIFFILTATFGLNRIIKFENKITKTEGRVEKNIVKIKLSKNNKLTYNENKITIENLESKLNINKNYIFIIDDEVEYQNFINILDIFSKKNITKLQIGE